MRFACAAAALAAVLSAQTTVIEHVRVFDGQRTLRDATVAIDGSRILAVGSGAKVPAGARTIDGRGKTLLPGFIDAHTHTITAKSLEQAPIFGVTTTLDMFTAPELAASIKRQEASG